MEVCLNSEPVFEEGDEPEDEAEHDEICETQSKKVPPPPTVGLEFASFDAAYDFYNRYAKEQGFGIRVSNSWFRSKRKERYRAKFSCSSAGFKKKSEANNPRPATRTGCPAMIIVKLVDSKRWRIVEVELRHNHPVSPEVKRFYKSHKRMIVASKKAYQLEPIKEIHTIKLYRTSTTAVDHTGYNGDINLNGKQVRFPIKRSKHLELKDGDVHALYNYFCRMKLTNPNFFYLMDLDDKGQLQNVFWADGRSKVAYNYFHDTILIDTTSLANNYEIPLISFVGVNHHGQHVLLGCAFLGDESTESFTWMFTAWITCMMGRFPLVIITDRSKPLQDAVRRVFPESHHCYCLCYIMQQLPEKLGGLKGYETIKRQIQKAVYNSMKVLEFETSWCNMMKDHHGLGDNKWLQALYEDRQRWVPVYLKDAAFAGMIPMKVNEALNAFFDGYVHKHTSFKEFLDKYDLALQRNHLKEATEDLESRKASSFIPKTRCSFEIQLSKLYTKEIFKKFQAEVEGMQCCFNTRQVSINGPITTYLVKERVEVEGEGKETRTFEVLYESTRAEVRCTCSLFNFNGYLCRHALNVLNHNGIKEVPSQYILPRWSRDYKVRSKLVDYRLNDLNLNGPLYWYNHLFQHALQIVEEGVKSEEHYKAVVHELGELFDKLSCR